MRINHNIAALNTHRQMGQANQAQQNSMEKLSSGLRINKAGDDAAGLAISEKMRGQIRGLDQAQRNSQDGISMIQTAEGALNETHDILQRMRELSVQSSNDTNTADDRKEIQKEIDQLSSEIDRISNDTEFNTKNLLDGSMGGPVDAAVANVNESGVLQVSDTNITDGAGVLTELEDSDGNSLGIAVDDVIKVSYVKDGETIEDSLTVGATTAVSDLAGLVSDADTTYADGKINLTATDGGTSNAINGLTFSVEDSSGNVRTAATDVLSNFSETTQAENVRQDGSATFQIGSNTGQNLSLSINEMTSSSLGVEGLQVSTQSQANTAINVIDTAISKVSAERSKLGATQNRLDHTINNLSTSSENLTAAESRIRDVDMAAEMMNQTKNSILGQASQAMLAQANQQPQGVLQLLQ
ncbi:flagellin [Halobacillus campisalis]|uniref:Flagellin n=1 Tax=Halobacillus campisalis TaxID=435909 RepID=A0ABW2JZJ6_9BACI|nr:flagellin [Halobacillus campisalis]